MRREPGGIVWLTGLSGAGKTTLARAMYERLSNRGVDVEVLDGDSVRKLLSADLGFSRDDRNTNVHRIAYVARLLAHHGVLVFVAAIAPYADARDEVKAISEMAGQKFLTVYVNAPLATVVARDTKGLYVKALSGEIKNFTGVSDPYEAPTAPDLELRTDRDSQDVCERQIVNMIAEAGIHGVPLPRKA